MMSEIVLSSSKLGHETYSESATESSSLKSKSALSVMSGNRWKLNARSWRLRIMLDARSIRLRIMLDARSRRLQIKLVNGLRVRSAMFYRALIISNSRFLRLIIVCSIVNWSCMLCTGGEKKQSSHTIPLPIITNIFHLFIN